ncbi:MAG: hypothetical protein GY816_13325 [Cytophagales bacterium]|nr:hypothetical protein [Cytophagales bacterium]
MKSSITLIFVLTSYFGFSQEEWAAGTIYFSDGRQLESDMRLLVSFNEGSLQTKNNEQTATLSPRVVDRFVYYDSLFEKFREFESVQTQFRKRAGSKKVFLELLYEGLEYSLYRRYIPVVKIGAIIVPLPNYYIGWAIWAEGRIEPGLFIHIKNDRAYQITKGIESPSRMKMNILEIKDERRLNYKLDESAIKVLLGDNFKKMKKEVRKDRLDISHEKGFIEGLKFLNGSTFQYNRMETPKKWRN